MERKVKNQISVIVPVYNTKEYLKECIESILAQKYSALEVILIDDGSTDGSGEICDLYAEKDERVKVLRQENAGQGAARNRALDESKGEYIAFVDSDDRIEPDMFSNMVAAMQEEGCDIAICGIRSVSTYTGRQADGKTVSKQTVLEGEAIMEAYVTGKIFTGMCDKLYKAQLFDKIRFPATRCREDVHILHEVLGGAWGLVFLPQIGYIQNIRAGSTEQKAYDAIKTELTEAALRRQQAYILQKYPRLYGHVALSVAKLYYETIQEILCRDNLSRKSDDYYRYLKLLKTELAAVEETALPHNMQETFQTICKAAEKPGRFYLEALPAFARKKIRSGLAAIRKIIK